MNPWKLLAKEVLILLQAWLADRCDSAMEYTRDLVQPEVRQLGGKGEVAAPKRRLGCGIGWGANSEEYPDHPLSPSYALSSPAIEEEPTDSLSTMWP